MTRTIGLALMLAAVVIAAATADRLELENGDVITGTIQLLDSTTVVIETDYGVLEIERSAIVRGEFGPEDREVGVSGREVPGTSLLFSFEFDRSLSDSTGVYRAVNNGMRFVADRNSVSESALRSDGSGTFLSIAPADELNVLDEFTVVFFVNLSDVVPTQYLFSKWFQATADAADGKLTIKVSDGAITVYLVDSNGAYHWFSAPNALAAGEWASVAVSFAEGLGVIYVDGAQVASRQFAFETLLADTSPVLVMTALSATDDAYGYHNATGAIDDLRLYSRALDAAEVELLAAQ